MAFTLVTISATYHNEDGSPASGSVHFSLTAPLANGGEIREPTTVVATLDGGGRISLLLPATDDPGTLPGGVTYLVQEQISAAPMRLWYVAVPRASSTLDLSTVAPALGPAAAFQYALDAAVVHLAGTETITGLKTFGVAPLLPAASLPESAVAGLGPDLAARALDATAVHLAGAETISGQKTFTSSVIGGAFVGAGGPVFNVTHPSFAGGADPTGVVDSTAAIQATINAIPVSGGIVFLPPATSLGWPAVYKVSATLSWSTKPIWLMGSSSGVQPTGGTQLRVAAGVTAINPQNGAGGLGARSRVSGLHLVGSDATPGTNDGILLQCSEAQLEDLVIEGFGRYGLNVDSSDLTTAHNANIFSARSVRCATNKSGGFHTIGANSNGGTFLNCDADSNTGWGILEESTLGNVYLGQHLSGNSLGAIRMSGLTKNNRFYGTYFESQNVPALQLDAGAASNIVEFTNCSRPDATDPIIDNSAAVNFITYHQGGLHQTRLLVGSSNPNGPYFDFLGSSGTAQFLNGAQFRFQGADQTSNWYLQAIAGGRLSVSSAQAVPLLVQNALQVSGDISSMKVGSGLRITEGVNCKQGVATLVAGSVSVGNTSVTANSRIFLTSQVDGGTVGFLRVSARTAGTSFVITSSSATDTSTVAYQIYEPA